MKEGSLSTWLNQRKPLSWKGRRLTADLLCLYFWKNVTAVVFKLRLL